MRRSCQRILATALVAVALSSMGCNAVVYEQLVTGLREGAVTAAGGIVEGLFNQTFGLEDAAAAEEGGNDLHTHG